MSLIFTRAPTVAPGDPIRGRDIIGLIRAFRDRQRSGLGDPNYRIHQFIFNLFRQARLPDESGLLWPALGEALETYAHIDPRRSALEWPLTAPGDPEGVNLANPLMQFIFGAPDGSVGDEEARLTGEQFTLELPNGRHPITLGDYWELAKFQRGAIDPATGAQAVPALAAAQSMFRFAFPANSPMGKSYGGFFPQPVVSPDNFGLCGDSDSNGGLVTNYFLKFTGLSPDLEVTSLHGDVAYPDGNPVVTYPGTCPLGTLYTAENHVCFVGRFPFAYYLYLNDGAGGYRVDRLLRKYWIEGPYEGPGFLQKAEGEQVPRAVHGFVSEFRGTSSQRMPDSFRIEEIAFDFQRFMSRQYSLAPARGSQSGENIVPIYPQAIFGGSSRLGAGTLGRFENGQTSHRTVEGFVIAGFYARGTGLRGAVNLLVKGDGKMMGRLALAPDDAGAAEALYYIDGAGSTPVALTVEVESDLVFATGGSITVEFAELYAYRPEFWDAYLICRLAATQGDAGGGVDGAGVDTDQARQLGEAFFRHGCLANASAAGVRSAFHTPVHNPIYDHARRRAREYVRLVNRQQFLAYEVAGDKSIVYFRRYLQGRESEGADVFAGIAPLAAPVTSGEIEDGVEYVVRATGGGRVLYMGNSRGNGERFVGATDAEYTVAGTAQVFEYEGIRSAARPGGWSNEWLMFAQTKCYHPGDSSNWQPEVYGDYFPFNNRCQFYRNAFSMEHQALSRFFFPASKTLALAPEAPSGYHYALNTNDTATTDFYRSCRIYEPDAEIESATIEFWGGVEVVKLVFKTRFPHCPTAPATVNKDPLTWSASEKTALAAETYRTWDNALREYALHQADPTAQCSRKTGDTAMSVGAGIADIFGSCYPHFFFTKLVPLPYQSIDPDPATPSLPSPLATRCTIDLLQMMETYLRAMGEGFVDGVTSAAVGCAAGQGNLYDFTWESLCYQAFGGRNIGSFSLDVRPDVPSGYGPLPNTVMYAQVFNRLAAAINLLDTARVMLPFEIQWRQRLSSAAKTVPADEAWPPGTTCSGGYCKCKWNGLPPSITTLGDWSEWNTTTPVPSPTVATTIASSCDGTAFQCVTTRVDVALRVSIPDDARYAIPESWSDLVDNQAKFLLKTYRLQEANRATKVLTSAESSGCAQVGLEDHSWYDLSVGYGYLMEGVTQEVTYCEIFAAGVYAPGDPVRADYGYIHTGAGYPEPECQYYGSRTYGLDIISDLGFAVTVPLVDP